MLPALEARHDVLALTLPGHAGGSDLDGAADVVSVVDAIERELDAAGLEHAHVVGNSLGGYLALQLAARGRADTVVALAPAGGWAREDQSWRDLLILQRELHTLAVDAAPQAEVILGSPQGRRQATRLITTNFEHIPADLLAHQLRGIAACPAAEAMIARGLASDDWPLAADRITCPVRIVWGTHDVLLPWPNAAVRYRRDWLPQADWIVLDDIGHCPHLDVPLETAALILGHTCP